MKTTTTTIQKLYDELNTLEATKTELKRIQSVKCRLKKQKGRKDYDAEMTNVLRYEQELKEVRQLFEAKPKPVTHYEQADVDKLDYDETVKALKSIQSKKTLSKWLNDREGDNDEFRNAVRIEKMLQAHRKLVEPVDPDHVRKTELQALIETLEESGDLDQATLIEKLKQLV